MSEKKGVGQVRVNVNGGLLDDILTIVRIYARTTRVKHLDFYWETFIDWYGWPSQVCSRELTEWSPDTQFLLRHAGPAGPKELPSETSTGRLGFPIWISLEPLLEWIFFNFNHCGTLVSNAKWFFSLPIHEYCW